MATRRHEDQKDGGSIPATVPYDRPSVVLAAFVERAVGEISDLHVPTQLH